MRWWKKGKSLSSKLIAIPYFSLESYCLSVICRREILMLSTVGHCTGTREWRSCHGRRRLLPDFPTIQHHPRLDQSFRERPPASPPAAFLEKQRKQRQSPGGSRARGGVRRPQRDFVSTALEALRAGRPTRGPADRGPRHKVRFSQAPPAAPGRNHAERPSGLRDPEPVNDSRPRRGVANFHSNFHRDKCPRTKTPL